MSGKRFNHVVFAHRLHYLRVRKGLSRVELADEIDTSVYMIRQFEEKRIDPKVNHICMLSDLFEVSTDYLIGCKPMERGSEPEQWDMDEQELYGLIWNHFCGFIPERQREAVIKKDTEGFNYAQLAREMNVHPSNARVNYLSGKLRLYRVLFKYIKHVTGESELWEGFTEKDGDDDHHTEKTKYLIRRYGRILLPRLPDARQDSKPGEIPVHLEVEDGLESHT